MVLLNYNEDKEQLARWNYDEPVLEISNEYFHGVIPASKVCYSSIKRMIEKSEYAKIAKAFADADK